MVITQICIGEPLDCVKQYMHSVRNFACKNGFEYKIINTVPAWYNGKCGYWELRTLSEWIRLDILAAEKYSLVVDWDIELSESFDVPDDITFVNPTFDSMVYNHDKTSFFQHALRSLKNEDRNDRHKSQLVLYKGIVQELNNTRTKYKTFNNYIHHGISKHYT